MPARIRPTRSRSELSSRTVVERLSASWSRARPRDANSSVPAIFARESKFPRAMARATSVSLRIARELTCALKIDMTTATASANIDPASKARRSCSSACSTSTSGSAVRATPRPPRRGTAT